MQERNWLSSSDRLTKEEFNRSYYRFTDLKITRITVLYGEETFPQSRILIGCAPLNFQTNSVVSRLVRFRSVVGRRGEGKSKLVRINRGEVVRTIEARYQGPFNLLRPALATRLPLTRHFNYRKCLRSYMVDCSSFSKENRDRACCFLRNFSSSRETLLRHLAHVSQVGLPYRHLNLVMFCCVRRTGSRPRDRNLCHS